MTPGVQGFASSGSDGSGSDGSGFDGSGHDGGSTAALLQPVPGPLPVGEEWVYEPRWGGMRVLVEVTEGVVRAVDAHGTDVAANLAAAGDSLADTLPDVVLDAEVVAHDDSPVLVVSDILRLYGVLVARRSWTERRGVLERLDLSGPHLQVAQVYDDGESLLSAVRELGLAGVIAKRRDAGYLTEVTPDGEPVWVTVDA